MEAELSEKRSESEKLDQQIEEKSAQVKAILNYIPDLKRSFRSRTSVSSFAEN